MPRKPAGRNTPARQQAANAEVFRRWAGEQRDPAVAEAVVSAALSISRRVGILATPEQKVYVQALYDRVTRADENGKVLQANLAAANQRALDYLGWEA